MDKPEKLATLDTQDTGQINVREYWRGNEEWTSQRNWQHWTHKTQDKYTLENIEGATKNGQAWLVHSSLSLQFSLTCICPVSCVSNVANFTGLSILPCPFNILLRLFVLCLVCSMLPVSLACPFFVAPSIFSSVYLSCVLCVQCCQFLWLVHSSLSLQFSLTCICPVYWQINVRKYWRGNEEWTSQRNWQHWTHKTQDK
jgi:hypothetical protein